MRHESLSTPSPRRAADSPAPQRHRTDGENAS